jgi:gamma-glutamyl-gamma-aminobutyrate hydrolase PuuD
MARPIIGIMVSSIEAIEREQLLAVEWHPEADQTGAAIYGLLVERARQAMRAGGRPQARGD